MYIYIYVYINICFKKKWKSYTIYLLHFRSGDVEDALKKIKKFICCKSAIFQAFIE